MATEKAKKKTEAAKVLLAAGWEVKDVFEVLQLDEPITVEQVVLRERSPWDYRRSPWSYRNISYLQDLSKVDLGALEGCTEKEL